MSARTLRGGHFYPLDVTAALDSSLGADYAERCARRARREPSSERSRKLDAGRRRRRNELALVDAPRPP